MGRSNATERHYAEWKPGYEGAATLWMAYYLVPVLCLIYALAMTYFAKFAGVFCLPLQLAGNAVRLAMPCIRRRVAPLRDFPAPVPQYAVRFTLGREVTYAADEGLASFVDGWLVVQAVGCAFSLRTCDALAPPSDRSLGFRGPAGEHRLEFNFSERGFRDEWTRWRNAAPPVVGVPVFPPVKPLANRKGWGHAGIAAILGIAAFAIPFHSLNAGVWLTLTALAILSLISLFRRKIMLAHRRLAAGKPARRSARSVLGAQIHLERLGEAYAADRRRRRRRQAFARLNID